LFTAAGEQVGFRTRKHLALLVRMALEPGKQFTRDYLADLLWPTAAPPLANHSLAQGLSVIKAKVARDAVVIRRATVGLAAGWIDVDVNHLGSNDVAIDGPFLDAFEIVSARPFEDWKDEYRARLIPQIRDCLVRQMDAARRIGDFPTVQRHAERLQDLDPLAEEAIRGIMEARAWASDRSGALKVFARYERRIAEELGARPSHDLGRMADLLRDGRRTPSRQRLPGYPTQRGDLRFEPEILVGREQEFSFLSDAWQHARRESPQIIVLTSDPGVGKTTLVNAFAASCQMEGAIIARAQAYDAERELPFAVLGELVKELADQGVIGGADPESLGELTRISPEIVKSFPGVPRPVDWSPELTPLRIADAFLKTIKAAAVDNPVILVVDDLHAADNASTAIIHSVARKITDTRVLIVLTARRSEMRLTRATWAFGSNVDIGSLQALDLQTLSDKSARHLVEMIHQTNQSLALPVDRILKASGGNPLAIELLTHEWVAHGSESLLHDLEALDTLPVPSVGIPRAIAAVFERQTARLDSATRAILELAALLGRRLTDLSLYTVLGLSPARAVESLSRLRDEGFLREVRGALEFRNELIRAQAYYSVAASARLHLHQKIAELLSQRPAADDMAAMSLEIAWHYLRGGSGERAIPFAHSGAQAFLSIGAPHEAEEVLNAILDVNQPPSDLRRTELLLAKSLIDQSKADAALAIIARLTVSNEAPLTEQAELAMLRASAEFILNTEPGEKYCEIARAALDCANKTGDAHLISRALFECARAGSEQGMTKLVEVAEQGIRRLKQEHEIGSFPIAFVTEAYCRMFRMDSAAFLDEVHQSLKNQSTPPNAAQMSFIHSAIGLASLNLCRMGESIEAYKTAFELAKKVGDDTRMSILATNLCVVETARGIYTEAMKWGEIAIALGESSKSSALQMTYTNLVDAYVLTGQEETAVKLMQRAREWLVPKRRWRFHCGFLVVNAAFELTRGNIALAIDIIRDLESVSRGREEANPIPGSYWKLKIFKAAHLQSFDEALRMIDFSSALFRDAPYQYLEILAAKTWLEMKMDGVNSETTLRELGSFDQLDIGGRRALLTLQGFLRHLPASHPTSGRGEPNMTRSPDARNSRSANGRIAADEQVS
jgi:DNA-binding SARP family transcriptional activator